MSVLAFVLSIVVFFSHIIRLIITHMSSALTAEEILHQLPAFILKYALGHCCLRMQRTRRILPESTFRVRATINHPLYLCPSDSSRTHWAWLDSDVKSAVSKVFTAQCVCGSRYGLHLSMCCDIAQCLSEVMSTREDDAP